MKTQTTIPKSSRLPQACAVTITMAFGALSSAHAATEFIANSFYDQQHPHSLFGYEEWADTVRELSNGELDPEVYTGTVLLAPRASLQGIRDNVVQVAHHAAIYTPSELPVSNAVQELGFNFSDPLITALAVTDFSMNNAKQLEEWDDVGVVYLGAYTTSPYVLFCREPVRNLSEMQGKRIRTAGSMVSLWIEEAGGIPVNVPSSEMYTGLDRGSLDCASNSPLDLITRSLWEVAEHTTLLSTGMYWSGPQWGYNPEFWAGLSEEHRHVLMEASAKAMTRMIVQYVKMDESSLTEAEEKGNNIYEPEDDLRQSAESFRDSAIANVYSIATERHGIEEPEALIDDFLATYEKWEDLIAKVDREDEEALADLAMREIYNKLDTNYGIR